MFHFSRVRVTRRVFEDIINNGYTYNRQNLIPIEKGSPIFWATSVILYILPKVPKQSPSRRQFAQSGHPVTDPLF
jgi:hypothetical protein